MDSDTETKDTSRRVNKVIVDSDEDEQAEQVEHQETHDDKESDDDIGLFGDEDENDNLFDDDVQQEDEDQDRSTRDDYDDQEDEYEDEDSRTVRDKETFLSLNIARFPPTHHRSARTCLVKMPEFLQVDPHAFEPSQFLKMAENRLDADRAEVGDNQTAIAEKSVAFSAENASTVRWKFARDSKTGAMIKQSNARFVRWSDGSMSLQLGNEMFDAQTKPAQDTFVTFSHAVAEFLQTTAVVDETMRFVPYSTSSNSHARLAQRLKKQQESNSATVGNVATTDDPEKLQMLALKTEEMNLKARRKLEAKKRSMEAREQYGNELGSQRRGGAGSSSAAGYDDHAEGSVYTSRYDTYEEDDGFVVPSEEEEEEEEEDMRGAKRLKDLKRRGAEQYKRSKKRDYSDEELEDEPEVDDMLDDEDEEEEATFTDEEERRRNKNKKRRIIEDDEE